MKRHRTEVSESKTLSAEEELFLYIGSQVKTMDSSSRIQLFSFLAERCADLDYSGFLTTIRRVDLRRPCIFNGSFDSKTTTELLIGLSSLGCCCEYISEMEAEWVRRLEKNLKHQRVFFNQGSGTYGGDVLIEFARNGDTIPTHCLDKAKQLADKLASIVWDAPSPIMWGISVSPACIITTKSFLYRPTSPIPVPKALECCVCTTKAKDIVFDTCKHLCVCSDCVPKLNTCPICRTGITTFTKVFVT